MAKKKRKNNGETGRNGQRNNHGQKNERILTARVKRWIGAIVMMVLAVVMALAFFHKSGSGGNFIVKNFRFLIGQTVFVLPFLLLMASFLIIRPKKRVVAPLILALIFLMIGIAGLLTLQNSDGRNGGWLGAAVSWPLLKYFSVMVGFVVFAALIIIGVLIIWELLPKKDKEEKSKSAEKKEAKEEKQNGVEALLAAEEKEELAKPKLEIKTIDLPKKKKEPSRELLAKPTPEQVAAAAVDSDYKRPPLNLFDTEEEKPASGDTNYSGAMIQKTLANFGIPVEMSEVNIGPTVTQYTLKPAEGVKLAKITALSNDLALSLAAHPIRIEAPIPGRSLVGIEVPNKIKAKVKLGTLIATPEFQKNTAPLFMGLGLDVMGAPMFGNLGGMPHLLVAGATGSGKTICLNSLIMSLIYRNSPKVMRLILIDPKRVEFSVYGDLPHLLTPVILNARKAVNALNWLVGEMERRFEVLRAFGGVRDIGAYNHDLARKPKKQEEGFEQLPYIVLIIDELADLMMTKGKEVEAAIVRLSQLARAVGIHLVVATQRPSVEVITGLIKANITSRIAFQVASQIDSRTILDCAGAEKLLGKGDMLFLSAEFSRPKRIQGSFVSSMEIKKIVSYIAKENTPEAPLQEFSEAEVEESENNELSFGVENGKSLQEEITNFTAPDDLYDEAKQVVLQYKKASASLLQRRLQVGYARAARLLDLLETNGIIGPGDGAKPRDILVDDDGNSDDGFMDASKVKFD